MKHSVKNENFITVIPYLVFPNSKYPVCLKITTLCYWYQNQLQHAVSHKTIKRFLQNIQQYDVSVYPDKPELGCYAMDGEIQFEDGERMVYEIFYKGRIIYRNK